MSRQKAPVPLVDKIAQAFEAVGKLQRNGTNRARRYKFTRASDVFEAVRLELFKRRVLVCPSEGKPEYVPNVATTNGGEQITECRLAVTYTFRDALEKLEPMVFNGVGRDVEDKALYKAQTGAQKALLKRFGLMAEEQDDPEFDGKDEQAGETLDEVAPLRSPSRKREQPIRDFEISALENAFADTHKEPAEIAEVMCSRFKVVTVAELKRYQFKEALAWASNGAGTLTPKPQAAPALQSSMYFPKPAPSFEMRVGGKTHVIETKTGSFSV